MTGESDEASVQGVAAVYTVEWRPSSAEGQKGWSYCLDAVGSGHRSARKDTSLFSTEDPVPAQNVVLCYGTFVDCRSSSTFIDRLVCHKIVYDTWRIGRAGSHRYSPAGTTEGSRPVTRAQSGHLTDRHSNRQHVYASHRQILRGW
nr:hypothetical protein CFP56_19487 [Quercus suber]